MDVNKFLNKFVEWIESQNEILGLEVEYGITTPKWTDVDPIDEGTRIVIKDGAKILYDKKDILKSLFSSLKY